MIAQRSDGEIWIKNLSASYLQVDDSLLKINQEKKWLGGERLKFDQPLDTPDTTFDYVLYRENFQSDIKRHKHAETNEAESLKERLAKVENDLQKELTCSICTNFLHKCMILTPCLHTFCSFCLFDFLKLTNQCPLCRVEADSVAKNSVLSNLVEIIADHFPPPPQKAQERKSFEQIDLAGIIIRNEEGVYIGSLSNNQRDGHGKYIFKKGAIYEGSWKNGKREGKGVLIYHDEDKYDGYWMNDRMHGMGKYIWTGGSEYEGNYEKGVKNGYGTMKYPNGEIYEGNWKNGEREGRGVYISGDGNRYDGFWMNSSHHGVGKYTWKDGEECEGDFQNDCFAGYGTMKYEDGRVNGGGWKDNDKEGLGILTLPNGDKYEGEIGVDSLKKQGKGILLTLENGDRFQGIWVDDVLQPQVTNTVMETNMREKLMLGVSKGKEKGL